VFGALAAFARALLTVFMVFGARLAAVVLAVAGDWMLAQFAGAFRAVADTFAIDHESDSWGGGRRGLNVQPVLPV
jgi:hypothetical protein